MSYPRTRLTLSVEITWDESTVIPDAAVDQLYDDLHTAAENVLTEHATEANDAAIDAVTIVVSER